MATAQVPVTLRTPDTSGNAFPTIVAGTVHRHLVYACLQDVVGDWFGIVRVPQDYASGPKIVVSIAANATSGVTTIGCATAVPANNESYNPGSYTSETDQDITVPGTAYLRKDVTFTLASGPAAGDDLLVRIRHNGTAANDTLAATTLIVNVVLEYTTS